MISPARIKYFFVLASAALIIFLACKSTSTKSTETFFLNLNDTVDYVGIDKCRMCHEDHYNTFIQTGMGSSFGAASTERSKADFTHQKPIYDAKSDMYYFPFSANGQIRIMEYRLHGRDTVHKRIETISHIIGSGHHTNSHFWMDNGYLFQAPLTYYTQQKKWDLPPGYEITNTHFSRKIDLECMNCHNGISTVEKGSINKFQRLPSGIDCERCHGPGELHVNLKSKGVIVDVKKETDRSIVNPARLPWKLQVDVCQRCHLQGNNVLKPGKQFADFRPGMSLDSVFVVYMPKQDQANTFFMAGHAERLQMSKCFVGSNKTNQAQYNPQLNFTCITCHNPHVSVRKTNIQKFNTACVNCHNSQGKSTLKKCSERESVLLSAANNCVQCHMPPNGTEDIPHVTVHDHYIRKPEKNKPMVQGKPVFTGIYAVNTTQPDRENYITGLVTWFEKFDADPVFLTLAGKEIQKQKVNPAIEIHYYYAHQQWDKIADMVKFIVPGKADAWTCYRMAKALDRTRSGQALVWYKSALEKQPLNADYAAEYANLLIREGQVSEAKNVCLKFQKEQPKHVLTLVNLGACYSLEKKYADAKRILLKAISLEPDNENAHLFLAEVYFNVGEEILARKELLEVNRINPENAEVRQKILGHNEDQMP